MKDAPGALPARCKVADNCTARGVRTDGRSTVPVPGGGGGGRPAMRGVRYGGSARCWPHGTYYNLASLIRNHSTAPLRPSSEVLPACPRQLIRYFNVPGTHNTRNLLSTHESLAFQKLIHGHHHLNLQQLLLNVEVVLLLRQLGLIDWLIDWAVIVTKVFLPPSQLLQLLNYSNFRRQLKTNLVWQWNSAVSHLTLFALWE